jgi:hypothetical protein
MSIYGKSFGLSTPTEYLDKLEWEFHQLMTASVATDRELSYHAMNLAMTGWHMTDWTYEHSRAPLKARFGTKPRFQDWIKEQSRLLAACRDVATASKHMTVDRNPDPLVETVDVPYMTPGTIGLGTRNVWHVAIDGELYSLDEFGRGLITFWQNYLESQRPLPG